MTPKNEGIEKKPKAAEPKAEKISTKDDVHAAGSAGLNESEKLDIELKRMEYEYKTLELEDLRERVNASKVRRESIIRQHKMMQQTLDDANRAIIASQNACSHKKGGFNMEGLLNGDANKYSVMKHTMPWGERIVMCTRCTKKFAEPKLSVKKENPVLYAKLRDEWLAALAWPTDNLPSGTQIFMFTNSDGGGVQPHLQ